MKRSLLTSLQEFFKKFSKKPWASFETDGIDQEGRLGFSISWNTSFIKSLREAGYTGATEEEMVQVFFLSTRMLPETMLEEEGGIAEATPNLSSDTAILRR